MEVRLVIHLTKLFRPNNEACYHKNCHNVSLYGLKQHILEISGDVTDAGRTNNEQGKIELLSLWTVGRLSLAIQTRKKIYLN